MMKKVLSLMLAFALACSLSVFAFAEGEQTGTTTLTAEVPEVAYTINIPADMTLEYGNTDAQTVGNFEWYVTAGPVDTLIVCNVSATPLLNGSNIIPVTYGWKAPGTTSWITTTIAGSSDSIINTNNLGTHQLFAKVDSWASAAPGTYTATITFNFSIQG